MYDWYVRVSYAILKYLSLGMGGGMSLGPVITLQTGMLHITN